MFSQLQLPLVKKFLILHEYLLWKQVSEDKDLESIGKIISSFLFNLLLIFFLKWLAVHLGSYPANQVCLFFSTVQAPIYINTGFHFIESTKF